MVEAAFEVGDLETLRDKKLKKLRELKLEATMLQRKYFNDYTNEEEYIPKLEEIKQLSNELNKIEEKLKKDSKVLHIGRKDNVRDILNEFTEKQLEKIKVNDVLQKTEQANLNLEVLSSLLELIYTLNKDEHEVFKEIIQSQKDSLNLTDDQLGFLNQNIEGLGVLKEKIKTEIDESVRDKDHKIDNEQKRIKYIKSISRKSKIVKIQKSLDNFSSLLSNEINNTNDALGIYF